MTSKFVPASLVFLGLTLAPTAARSQGTTPYSAPADVIEKIKAEGIERSQIMATLGTLTDQIGPRLTGSPAVKQANEWTRDAMAKWGMQNAHLETWGPFGRGWTLKSFDAEMSAPYGMPLIAYPKAWSPSTKGTISSEVVLFNPKTEEDFKPFEGKLRGKIVLLSETREIKPDFTPQAERRTAEDLAKLAAAPIPTPTPSPTPPPDQTPKRILFTAAKLNFLKYEGAAVLIDNSPRGIGGTVFVAGAAVPQDIPLAAPDIRGRTRLQPYSPAAADRMLPQVTMSTEHYNLLARLVAAGKKVKLKMRLDVEFQEKDPYGYNTIAEIPGTDLKDEVVMLGGHLDSWQGATGATDNAVGAAVAMEAARIIQALGLKPRRTIRVALWTGEEQGLLGSFSYIKQHFAEMRSGGDGKKDVIVKKADYDKLSAYFNLDNGGGKLRGIFAQSNPAVVPIFTEWLKPFASMDAATVTLNNTGSTDHIFFDQAGLPGFQFIQDRMDYMTRTHHSNQDVLDRIQPDDAKQAATIMAAFVYQTAMMDQKMPRKPAP